jgi:uncharacterized SAM-binding protein YcdF (DUF218 family)
MKSRTLKPWLRFAFALAIVLGTTAFVIARAGEWLAAPAASPRRADAIVVLGGDEGDRAQRALELYREGFAPILVLTGLEYGSAAPPSALTWRADYLSARGVPRSALRFEVDSKNSYGEAVNILRLMREQGWRRVIVVSAPPHMRRLDWTWSRVFKGSNLDYVLVASRPDWWSPQGWWREEKSGAFVIMEFIKLGYYVAKR